MDPKVQDRTGVTYHVRQENRWQTRTLCRLPSTERDHQEGQTSATTHQRSLG